MIISYSLIMAVLLFNLAMVAVALLRRRTGYLTVYSTPALVLLALFGALRLILPISFPFTIVVSSFDVVPSIEAALSKDVWPGSGVLELQFLIILIWGVGSLAMIIWTLLGVLRERRYRKLYRVVESAQVNNVAKAIRLKNVKIIVSPDVVVPYIMGFIKARIYLPNIALTDDAIELILKHEYHHFKSRDILIKMFYLLLSIVFWWNPIVHLFQRDLDRLLEIRCDATMTKRMSETEKTSYMETLLFIAKHIQAKDTARLASASSFVRVGKYGFMEQRFRLIQSSRNMKSAIKQIVSVSLVVLVFLASFMVIIQPAHVPSEYDLEGGFRLSPENAYILITQDGRHKLFVSGQFVFELTEDYMETEYFMILPIIKEE